MRGDSAGQRQDLLPIGGDGTERYDGLLSVPLALEHRAGTISLEVLEPTASRGARWSGSDRCAVGSHESSDPARATRRKRLARGARRAPRASIASTSTGCSADRERADDALGRIVTLLTTGASIPTTREHTAAFTHEDELWGVAGRRGSLSSNRTEVEIYDPIDDAFSA